MLGALPVAIGIELKIIKLTSLPYCSLILSDSPFTPNLAMSRALSGPVLNPPLLVDIPAALAAFKISSPARAISKALTLPTSKGCLVRKLIPETALP